MQTAVIDAFLGQAEASEKIGSPFIAALCRLLAQRLDHSTRFGHKILDWPGDPQEDALPLRACGALHALARSWKEPELLAAYPPAPFDERHMWYLIVDVLTRHDNFLAAWLDSPPQTNEVGRSAILLGAALHVSARTRLPIDLYEIGASGGLNLAFDSYRYHLSKLRVWGPADAPLTVPCEWRGAIPPLSAKVNVVSRQGCDRSPLDPANEDDAARLLAYIWPDQPHRLARTEAAIKRAAASGTKVERADAGDWVARQFNRPPQPGVCRMLFHTIVWQYMPPETRERIETTLAQVGALATEETPVARLAFEPDSKGEGGGITLTTWPAGERQTLGRADFHGRWVEWAEI